jgi:hypothetical protein
MIRSQTGTVVPGREDADSPGTLRAAIGRWARESSSDQAFFPDADTYVLHPCLVNTVGGIRQVPAGSAGAGDRQ